MNINKLIEKIKNSSVSRTQKDRLELLRDAYILDKDGYYHPEFFSKETVEKDRINKLTNNN